MNSRNICEYVPAIFSFSMRHLMICIIWALCMLSFNLHAQNEFNSEDDLKEKAEELFEQDKLVEATPLFAQLLSLYPQDLAYNYKYGACLLASDSDKEKALKYLNFATSKPNNDPLAYYYLGKAHHLNYNFAKAVKFYSRFKNKASTDQKEKYQVERQIEMCKNGNNLLSRLNEVQVIEKQTISSKDFFRIYDLEGIDGRVLKIPEDFLTKEDKKRGETSIMYLPANAKEVYYSSYGKKGENGRDIYKRVKLGNGTWSEAVDLGVSINTPFDEDYAFIHPDGRTLYFASKGHSSMGGYDLFQSTYDQSIANWTEPKNLDFAFSSADDDILFITDENKVLAYFASNRTNKAGEFTVYKVMVEKAPADLSIIKGKFIVENSNNANGAKITVVDQLTNQTVGVYETDANGNYQIEIASNGGQYKFNIETTEDAPIHTGIVEIPKQDEFEVLGQELRLVGSGSEQQLVIKNIFDGTTDQDLKSSNGPLISSELLRKKASLDVNFKADQLAANANSLSNPNANGSSEQNSKPASNSKPSNQNVASNTNNQSVVDSRNSSENKATEESNLSDESDENKIASNTSPTNNTTPNSSEAASTSTEEIVSKLDEIIASKNQEIQSLDQAANHAYEQAAVAKKEADDLFSQAEKQQANSNDNSYLTTAQYAQEAAAQAVFSQELAQDLEKLKANKEQELSELEGGKAKVNQLISQDNLAEAELKVKELELGNQSSTPEYSSYLEKVKKSLKGELNLNASKVSNFKQKQDALAAEKTQINEQLISLREVASESSGSTKKEAEQRIEQLALDSADMNYQYIKAKDSYKNALSTEMALQLKLQETELLQNKMESNSPLNSAALDENEKQQLTNELKTLEESGKLGALKVDDTNLALENNSSENQVNNSQSSVNSSSTISLNSIRNEFESISSLQSKYTTNLNQVEATNSSETTNQAKIAVYDSWMAELEEEKLKRQNALSQVSSNSDKEILKNEINQLNNAILEKEKVKSELEISTSLASNSSPNTTETNQNLNSNTTNNQIQESSPKANTSALPQSNIDVSQVDGNTTVSDKYSVFDFEQNFNYGSNQAKQELTKAKVALVEAEDLSIQADAAKQAAFSLPTADERNRAFEKANLLEEASQRKQVEAANQYASINSTEFNRNAQLLQQANNYDIDFESSNLDIANLLADEAEVYYQQATEIRATVDPTTRLSKIEADLQKAYDYEMLALRKQGEALNLLAIVETEYSNKDTQPTASTVQNEATITNIQTIQDAEVLAVQDANVAQAKGDSLTAEVKTLRAKVEELNTQAEQLAVGEERNTLLAEIETLNNEITQKENKASIYYERKEQIETGFDDQVVSSVIKPASVSTSTISKIDLDTIDIDDARAEVVLNSQAYINYVNRAQQKNRLVKEAELSYQNALAIETEKAQLQKQALSLNAKIESAADEAEKSRLVKEATIIEQKINAKQNSIDSVNNVLKVKNFMIREAENDMQNAIAGLSEIEQGEIQKLAKENVNAEPIALNNSLNNAGSQNEVTTQELQSQETSQGIAETATLPNADSQLATTEVNHNGSNIEEDRENESNNSNATSTKTETPESESNLNSNLSSIESNQQETKKSNNQVENSNLNSRTKETSTIPSAPLALAEIDKIPRQVKQAIFLTIDKNQSAYNNSKPIPIATKENMPEGLIYKIQVGAFKKPIPQDLFKGFAPLMGEKGPNGITRYTAGIFLSEAQAVYARDEIRKLGYSDAFVVAFLNGERVSINRAREAKPEQAKAGRGDIASQINRSGGSTGKNTSSSTSSELPSSFSNNNIQKVEHVGKVKGLFYTIQIGVFSKPVQTGTFNYSNLYVKPLTGGLIRYNVGTYQTALEANNAKATIAQSVADAFVTAYYNGKRISLAEAARIENQ